MDILLHVVKDVQGRLDHAGIASAVIGGLAVAVWGEPRLTRDVDFKVLARRKDVERLLKELGPGFQPAHDEALEFARQNGILFVIGPEGVRVDLLLADTYFDEAVIARAVEAEIQPGVLVRLCTPEDLIIYKLMSLRPRDQADALSVVQRLPDLDRAYIEEWLQQFELAFDDSTLVGTFRAMMKRRGKSRLFPEVEPGG